MKKLIVLLLPLAITLGAVAPESPWDHPDYCSDPIPEAPFGPYCPPGSATDWDCVAEKRAEFAAYVALTYEIACEGQVAAWHQFWTDWSTIDNIFSGCMSLCHGDYACQAQCRQDLESNRDTLIENMSDELTAIDQGVANSIEVATTNFWNSISECCVPIQEK